ncbi:hypothetical protein V8F33_003573 [Rhypophila sp. PSN 637]
MTPTSALHNALITAWESHKSSLASRRKEHLTQFETITTGGGICQYGTLTLTEKDCPAAYKHIQDKREEDNRINKEQNKETNSLPELTRLRYTAEIVRPVAPNKEPDGGYPLYIGLHGGGGYPTAEIKTLAQATSSNDTQWNYMSRAYKDALTLGGVWVALRGIGDTWDLHFTAAGYILLDRLIENMILFGAKQSPMSNDAGPTVSINPNRVYLIGFSAGGDGVYRLANRLAQRFAAVNMGGGHPGSIIQHAGIPDSDKKRLDNGLLNVANTPTCLQVGMGDRYNDAAVRSWTVAQSGVDLDANQAHYRNNVFNNPGANIYDHAVYIHTDHINKEGDWHFSWESSNFRWNGKKSPDLVVSEVIADYKAWKDSWKNGQLPTDTPGTVRKPTNALLHWFTESHKRSSVPQYIVWDLTTPRGNDNINEDIFRCLGAKGSQNYWLDIGDGTRLTTGVPIVAGMDDKTNTITIYSTGNMSYLRILLRPDMQVSIEKDITVQIYSQDNTTQAPQIITPIRIGWSTNVINDTVARNDPSLVFCSDIVLTKDSNGGKTWHWDTNSPKTPARKSRL